MFRLTTTASFLKLLLSKVSLACGDHIIFYLGTKNLCIKGNDGDQQVVVTGNLPSGAIFSSGLLALPKSKVMDIVNSFSDAEMVTIAESDDKAIIKCRRSRFKVTIVPPSIVPITETSTKTVFSFRCSSSELRTGLSAVNFCSAKDDFRKYLCGVNLTLENKQVKLAASNGHILGYVDFATDDFAESGSCIIPRQSVENINRLIIDHELLSVSVTDSALCVSGVGFYYLTNLIEGTFPDFDALIPTAAPNVSLPTKDFFDAVKRVGTLAENEFPSVKLLLKEDGVVIESGNSNEASLEKVDLIRSDYEGKIALSLNYLTSILASIKTKNADCAFTGELSPVVVHGSLGDTNKYILTPMRS